MFYKKIIFSGAILLLSLSFLALGCKQTDSSQQDSNQSIASTILTDEPENYDLDFNQIEDIAKEKALAWRSDAKLVYVNVEMPTDLDVNRIKHTFVYDSTTLDSYHYLVSVNNSSRAFIRALIPKEDYLGYDYNQILPLYWKINFVSTLQKCDSAGGETYRGEYGNNLKLEINLMRKLNESQKWVCEYTNLKTDESKEILVDSSTGAVSQQAT